MRVDDQVRNYALLSERHIFLSIRHADRALLPVSGGKLVTDLWNTDRANLDLCEALTILVSRENHRVDHTTLRVLDLG